MPDDFVTHTAVADKPNADFFVFDDRFMPAFYDVANESLGRILGDSVLRFIAYSANLLDIFEYFARIKIVQNFVRRGNYMHDNLKIKISRQGVGIHLI
jgi:hypothetical protein